MDGVTVRVATVARGTFGSNTSLQSHERLRCSHYSVRSQISSGHWQRLTEGRPALSSRCYKGARV